MTDQDLFDALKRWRLIVNIDGYVALENRKSKTRTVFKTTKEAHKEWARRASDNLLRR